MSPVEVRAEIDRVIVERRNYFAAYLHQQPGIQRHEAEDLIHDAYVQACSRVESYRGFGAVERWLFAILKDLFLARVSQPRNKRAYRNATMQPLAEYAAYESEWARRSLEQLQAAIDVQHLMAQVAMSNRKVQAIREFMAGPVSDRHQSKLAHHAVRSLRKAARVVRCGK